MKNNLLTYLYILIYSTYLFIILAICMLLLDKKQLIEKRKSIHLGFIFMLYII